MPADLKLLLAIIPVFLLLDYLWLGKLMQGFYLRELGEMARREGEQIKPRLLAAAGVYLVIPAGIVLFALPRVDPGEPLISAIGWGFFYGVTLYGCYDLTNRATLRHWPLKLVCVDICWGGFLCALTTCIAAAIATIIR